MADKKKKDPAAIDPSWQRDQCCFCDDDVKYDPKTCEHAEVNSNVKAFADRKFTVWRCPGCRSLHCLDVVDLGYYYSHYPHGTQTGLDLNMRLAYRNLSKGLLKNGMKAHHKFLDYGCNQGYFLDSLRERGYNNVFGYDPYIGKFNDKSVLEKEGPFDYILIQDVLEHVEDPLALLKELNSHLAPGGYIQIGTPNAGSMDLYRLDDYLTDFHTPYHTHMPTRKVVEDLGKKVGLKPVWFHDRSYADVGIGINCAVIILYMKLKGGFIDALVEPIDLLALLLTPKFYFYFFFGYFVSAKASMSNVLQKPVASKAD